MRWCGVAALLGAAACGTESARQQKRALSDETCGVTVVSAAESAVSLALDDDAVYWSTREGAIRFAPRDGSADAATLAEGENSPSLLVVDETSLYWVSGPTIRALPLDGDAPRTLATVDGATTRIYSLVRWDDALYALVAETGVGSRVVRYDRNDGSQSVLFSDPTLAWNSPLAADERGLYLTLGAGLHSGLNWWAVSRLSWDGELVTLATVPDRPIVMTAADDDTLFYGAGRGSLVGLAKDGSSLVDYDFYPNGDSILSGIAVDEARIYTTGQVGLGAPSHLYAYARDGSGHVLIDEHDGLLVGDGAALYFTRGGDIARYGECP